MSHTTRIQTVPIKDIIALRMAAQRMKANGINCELAEHARPRMYFREQEVECDYVLRLPDGKYDVGFERQKDGSYAPIFDEYADEVGRLLAVQACPFKGSSEERAMHAIGALSREYARCAAVNAASASGYFLEEETVDTEGAYQLVFASY